MSNCWRSRAPDRPETRSRSPTDRPPLLPNSSAKLQTLESPGIAPGAEVSEEGGGAGRVADREAGGGAGGLALVVVVARGAIGSADHPARAGEQQIDPGVLGRLGDLDLAKTAVQGAPDDQGDGLGPVSYTHLRAHETGRNLVCRL